MAPKRAAPIEEAPASDEEETTSTGEEEEEDGEEESSSEDDQTQPQLTQNLKIVTKPDSAKHANSESECDSDSESEDVPPLDVKPLASKPMKETPTKSTKKTSTDNIGKSTSKRGSEVENDGKDSKRPKTKDSESSGALEKADDTKKQLFQRLWSEEDEVALLKGVIAFIEKKGTDPSKDMNAFYEFIEKSLHIVVALSQLKEKVSRLKRKFENHVKKGKQGEDKTFSRKHDQELFDLSKKIWGSEGLGEKRKSLAPKEIESDVGVKETKKVKKKEMENQIDSRGMRNFDKGVSMASMEDYVIERGLDMVDGSKKSEMEVKWRKLQEAELELFLKRRELIIERGKLLLASCKKSEQRKV